MNSNSQARQDLFALSMIEGPGTFLDIGCADPVMLSNTLLLEEHGWRGLCVDQNPDLAWEYAKLRKSPFIHADAQRADYHRLLLQQNIQPRDLDYVSLDVDNATEGALRQLLASDVRFKIATVEHDAYRMGDGPRNAMRKMLKDAGYTLARANVRNNGLEFEDWWIMT